MANIAQFPLDLKQTKAAIESYKERTDRGEIARPDIADFCAGIGVSLDTLVEVIKAPKDKNIRISSELKIFLTWMQAQYMTHPGWDGQQIKKALIALKQDWGGFTYQDKADGKQGGDIHIVLEFGGEDGAFD